MRAPDAVRAGEHDHVALRQALAGEDAVELADVEAGVGNLGGRARGAGDAPVESARGNAPALPSRLRFATGIEC